MTFKNWITMLYTLNSSNIVANYTPVKINKIKFLKKYLGSNHLSKYYFVRIESECMTYYQKKYK